MLLHKKRKFIISYFIIVSDFWNFITTIIINEVIINCNILDFFIVCN